MLTARGEVPGGWSEGARVSDFHASKKADKRVKVAIIQSITLDPPSLDRL